MGGKNVPSKAKSQLKISYVPAVDCTAAIASVRMGRPSKYKKEFCELIIEIMTRGDDVCHFCCEVGICRDTFSDWVRNKPEFSSAYKKARIQCKAWWLNAGQKGMLDKSFNTGLYFINMKNRFNWNDRKASYPAIELPGFCGKLSKKAEAANKALEEGKLTCDQHNMIMNSILSEAQIRKADDFEARIALVEKDIAIEKTARAAESGLT